MFSYFNPTRGEISCYGKNTFVLYGITSKSLNPTFEFFLRAYNTIYLILSKLCDKGNRVLYNFSICMIFKTPK